MAELMLNYYSTTQPNARQRGANPARTVSNLVTDTS
jgi:hypothetical protein